MTSWKFDRVWRGTVTAGLLAAGLVLGGCSATESQQTDEMSLGSSKTISQSATKPVPATASPEASARSEIARHFDKLVVKVASFKDAQPSGVAVSESGRVFVSFPYWSAKPELGLAEVFPDGTTRPYPTVGWNCWDGQPGPSALHTLVSAEAIAIDDLDYLWVLDSGNPQAGDGIVTAGPKLVRIDLTDNSIAQVFYLDHKRQLGPTSFLSDFRVDIEKRVAYLADAGSGAIVVYDLSRRWAASRLVGDPSTAPVPGTEFTADATRAAGAGRLGVWGLELSNDREWLYYQPLGSRELYRVPTAALLNTELGDQEVKLQVETLGNLGTAVDGLWFDTDERLYAAGLENHAIIVREPHGQVETVVAGPELRWPDSLTIAADGYLYFTTSMRHLSSPYSTQATRHEPYALMRVSVEKVQQAVKAAIRAEEARERAAEARASAERKRREAELARRAADTQRQVAEQAARKVEVQAEAVYEAHALRSQASQSVATVARHERRAAEQARFKVREAELRATSAREATDVAERLMRLARARAEEALVLRDRALAAQVDVELAEAEVRAAQVALKEAELVFQESERQLGLAERALAATGLQALQTWAAAKKADQTADAVNEDLYSAQAAAEVARRIAEQATQQAVAAEFAETPGVIQQTGTASVPTD
ncbi:L-dopachrome tautomerase-related protein [Mucisphaera calidilacus]|uniref:Major royal jelly protein n=1 Tax=Mucisphaera calidilacus TaxID=2527982 RepID=A0A518BZB0_9BACT|nr:L-dopachrome tautomerase-related protein [Mucisphaera calidilacus]QDU72304.1 Major royal jelly protein [Mucisphaera calidilacus]